MKQTITIFTLFISSFVFGQNDYATLSWQVTPDFNYIGVSNMIPYDVDNDGTVEMIYGSTTTNAKSLIKVLGYGNENYQIELVSAIFNWKIKWMEIYDIAEFGGEKLFVLSQSGEILIMNISTLAIEGTIGVHDYAEKFIIADTNEDGNLEIVLMTSNKVYLLDLAGNVLFIKNTSSAHDVAIANVDNDPAPEIIVSALDGYVLNGNDFAEEWVLEGGFGGKIVLQDINNDGKNLIYAAEYTDYVRCYDVVLASQVWELFVDDDISNLHVEDPNGDGNFEILVSKQWDNGIESYDVNSHELLWSIPIKNDDVGGMTFGDFDNDGEVEYVYGCGHNITSEDLLVVFTPSSLTNEWVSLDLSGGLLMNTGYYNNEDGNKDLIIGSASSNSGYDGGLVMVYDGATKDLLKSPQIAHDDIDSEAYAMIHYEGNTYLLYLFNDKVYIYNETIGNFVIQENFFADYIQTGEFVYLDQDAPPVLITLHYSGKLKIHEFHENILTEIWSSPGSDGTAFEYQVGNFDTDPDIEIAFLSNAIIAVYNTENFVLEKEFNLGSGLHSTFHIADIDNDETREVYFKSSLGGIKSINYDTSLPLATFPLTGGLNSFSVRKIKVENVDETPQKEMIIFSDRISVYNSTIDTLKFSSDVIIPNDIFSPSWTQNLIVEDIDQDDYMEIIAAGFYGVFEYKVNVEYLDIVLPKIITFLPHEATSFIATNSDIKIGFSEKMDETSLSTIEVKDEMDNLLSYTINYDEEIDVLTLTPSSFWTSDSEITVTIYNTSSDETGNPLDGNGNNFADGNIDDFSWSFFTGTGIDEQGPAINDLNTILEVFQGIPLTITGVASDNADIGVSHIAYIEYGIDIAPAQGQGIAILPIDEIFDEVNEEFEIVLNTSNLSYGEHTIYFKAQDALDNWGEVSSITFNIIEEGSSNWTHYACNVHNTSANSESELTYPFRVKYENIYASGSFISPFSRSIAIENYLIFSVSLEFSSNVNKLYCLNIHTGETIWENTFDISDRLSTPAYAYGNIYVQIGDDADSKLACYNLATGELIWETTYAGEPEKMYSPIAAGGVIYITEGLYHATIGAYDAFDGNLLWKHEVHPIGDYDAWSPAYYQDTIYGYARRFAAINPATGEAYYKLTEEDIPFTYQGGSMDASPIIDVINNQIILTSRHYIHALSLDTKEIIWTLYSVDYGEFKATPALYNGELYIPTSQQLMRANVITGEINWQNLDYNGYFEPVTNQHIVAFSTYHETIIFDIQSMEEKALINNLSAQLTLSADYLIITQRDKALLIVLEYNPNPIPLAANLEVIQSIDCNGENGVIQVNATGASNNYTYEWNINQLHPTNTLGNIPAGDYVVTVSDLFGSSVSASITLEEPAVLDATITTTPDIGMSENGSALVEPTGGTSPYTYEWADFPGVNSNQLNDLEGGDYNLTIIDANGCSITLTADVETVTNTDEILWPQFKVSPNPTTGIINIQSENATSVGSVTVITAEGKKVRHYREQILNNISIDLINEPSRIYFLSIITSKAKFTFKISIVR